MSSRRPDETREAAARVESELEELADLEGSPALPASALATQAAAAAADGAAAAAPRAAAGRNEISREILRLAWPVMLTLALGSVGALVDRAMIGRLGNSTGAAVPLAAVGYATQFFFLIQSGLFAVGLACVAMVARAIGAGDPQRARAALAASLQVAIAISALFAALIFIGGRRMLVLLGAEAAVVEAALPYLQLLLSSAVLLAICLVIDSALRANRDTRTPLYVAIVATAVKLLANWLLIFGAFGLPRLELVGAGVATLLAQLVALALFVSALVGQRPGSPLRLGRSAWRAAASLRGEVVRIALPGVAERVVMNVALLAYFWVLSRYYGTIAVAVYTVGVPLLSFTWIPGNGYAQACATLVGQALGARVPREAVRVGWIAAGLALATAVALGVPFALGREWLAGLFTADAQVIAGLGPFLLALAIAQPFLQLHFALGGAHRGAGDTWTPLVAASVSNWLFRVPMAVVCAAVLELPVTWVWAAILVDHAMRALHLGITFWRGRWIHARSG